MNKTLFCFLLFITSLSKAQLHLPSLYMNNDVSNCLSKVIADFPNGFSNILGVILSKDVQATNYASTVNINGAADSSVIIQNGETTDNIYSWKETVFETDDYDKAKAKYHEYFMKIKATAATVDGKRITLQGEYDAPDDSKRFATVLFATKPATQALKDVVVDLTLQYLSSGWEISVSVYEHKDYGVEK